MLADFRNKSAFIGIALHDEKVSMVKLRKAKKKIIVEGFSIAPLPTETQLQQILNDWVDLYRAKHCRAAWALPASQIIYKHIHIPVGLNDLECEVEIAANLQRYLPAINEPLHFDFLPIKRNDHEVELQIIAARSLQVSRYCQVTKAVGLKIKSIDVDAYAIVRAVNFISPSCSWRLILDMSVTCAQFILLQEGKVFSIHFFSFETEDLLWPQIKNALQSLSVTIALKPIEKILLTGELRQLTDLKNQFQDDYAITVETMDSLREKLNIQTDFAISAGLAALGVALRGYQHA